MAKQSIRLTNSAVVSALNNKADIELENSSKAAAIESLANSAATTAAAASKVADAAVDLIEVQMPLKVNKSGDTFNGNVVIDGNLTVTGDVNIPADGISGSVEVATSATKDGLGNVISDTYLTKTDAANTYFNKKISDSCVLTTHTGSLAVKNNDIEIGVTPTTNKWYSPFVGVDKNGNSLFWIQHAQLASSVNLLRIIPSTFYGAQHSENMIQFSTDSSGNCSVQHGGYDIEKIYQKTSDYIQLYSGLYICWGSVTLESNVYSKVITFPKTFSDVPTVSAIHTYTNANICRAYPITTANFTLIGTDYANGYNWSRTYRWVAIGLWK